MQRIYLILLILFAATASNSAALVRLDVSRGNIEPIPIAIQDFEAVNPNAKEISESITQIVTYNLEFAGLCRRIDPTAALEKATFDVQPRFSNWRKINATILLVGKVEVLPEQNIVNVKFRIWDPYGEQQVDALSYQIKYSNWRRLGHKISDRIYQRLTGEEGYFDSRVVFVAESGNARNRIKRLAIMDQDSQNFRYLTDGKQLVLTPRFDSQSQRITYMSYRNREPQVFVLDLNTGLSQLIGKFPGMSFAPRFAPDGQNLVLSFAKGGSTSIYEINIRTNERKKLTNDFGTISTSPSYSPDGSKIVFSSDRGGSQQLYIMNRDGSDVKRISFGQGSYATPVWSPRGDYIAFTKPNGGGGNFYIGIIQPDGNGERLLASSWLAEGPTWSSNGRVIMFYKQTSPGASSQLYAVDVTGYGERAISTVTAGSDPAWSPLLRH